MKRILLCTAVLLVLSSASPRAGVSIDVAMGMEVNEDTRIFLNVTNQTWRPTVPTTFIQSCPDPEDDFPVIAFLAYQSHRSPSFILNLRREGYSWADVFFQVNVSPSVLFVGVDRDPGPPYGRAWGYWKKHYRPGTRVRYRFADRDIVGLIKVQTVARHFGTSPFAVIEAQHGGKAPERFAANRWRQKNGRETWDTGHGKGQGMRGGARDNGGDQPGKGEQKGQGMSGGAKEDRGGHPSQGKKQGQGKGHGKGKGGGKE